ncbi:MAG: hypothetical protein VX000_02910, partial [Myxococcota bacterium]|nr:hypothetical protein [Myxococcota bacterium]
MSTHQTPSSDRSNHPREFRIFHALDADADGLIDREILVGWLESAGLLRTDPRLAGLMQALEPLDGPALDLADFSLAVSTAGVLVESAVQGSLTIPD